MPLCIDTSKRLNRSPNCQNSRSRNSKIYKQGFVKKNESVVLILTGHLLKDPEFTLNFHRGTLFAGTALEKEAENILASRQRAPIVLDASVSAVLKVLQQIGGVS